MIEEKIGNDEKGADMKLWNKNAQLGEVGKCRETVHLLTG
jgi:hypothetical protein